MADDYLSSGDYRNRLAARDALGKAIGPRRWTRTALTPLPIPPLAELHRESEGNQMGPRHCRCRLRQSVPAMAIPSRLHAEWLSSWHRAVGDGNLRNQR